jgi:hypothetical protein
MYLPSLLTSSTNMYPVKLVVPLSVTFTRT